MKTKKGLRSVLLLSVVLLTACQPAGSSSNDSVSSASEVTEAESLAEVELSAEDESQKEESELVIAGDFREIIGETGRTDNLTIESGTVLGLSTQGGEITRYKDSNGIVYRYSIQHYGEMGRINETYYIVDDALYYSELLEEYNIPMYMENSHVMYWSVERGMVKEGLYYEYDELQKEFRHSDDMEIECYTLNELEDLINSADKPEVSDDYSEYNILVMNGYLLGGYHNGQWIDCNKLATVMAEENNYKIYENGVYREVAVGQIDTKTDSDYMAGPWIDFSANSYDYGGGNLIACYSGVGELKIQPGTILSTEQETYQTALQDYLQAAGLTDPFELKQVTKIDIDGDGQDEVFVQAYYFNDELQHESAGLMFMRKVINGTVESIPVPPAGTNTEGDMITIRGFVDLNGDGVKEMLLSSQFIGYSGYMVYEFKDGGFVKIYENGTSH